MNRRSLALRKTQRGAALVIALAMIVLVTGVILAFFSMATINQTLESVRANQVQADLLAYSGGTYVIGQLMAEITDPNRSSISTTSGESIYLPANATNAAPARYLTPGVSATDTNFFTLIRQSTPSADSNVSTNNTAEPASDGRLLSTNRWNEPRLLFGGGFSQTNQMPNWIYVDQTGGPTNSGFVTTIGRFAYNVYHTGGLLNANVAGYPSSLTTQSTLMTYLKNTQGGADVLKLASSLSANDANALAALRFPDFSNPLPTSSMSNYVGRVLSGSTNGFLSVAGNEYWSGTAYQQNMFENRQDLIRYITTQAPNLTPILPYLTHFSRSVNAPSYGPVVTIRFSTAGLITHYDDQGNSSTYTVSAGDPIMQHRFSLARIAWLTPTGPASGISAAAIQSCFGLQWDSTNERWNYTGSTGSTMQSAIETLDQVAGEGREPNYFEVLKAGILSNTLGGAAADGCLDLTLKPSNQNCVSLCPAANDVLDANKDLHVLQIGANIIDNADSDNYPTRIAMNFGGTVIEKAGVEDIPYFYGMDMPVFLQATAGVNAGGTNIWTMPTCAFVWVPELIEPHRQSTPTSGPTAIQVNFLTNSILYQAGFAQNTAFSAGISTQVLNRDLSALPPIQVASNYFENFRAGPNVVTNSGAANSLGQLIPGFFTTNAPVQGFMLADYSKTTDFPAGLPMQVQQKPYLGFLQAQGLIIRLQYLTPGGQWKTYSTLGGNEALPTSTGIWGLSRDDFGTGTTPIPILKATDGLNNNSYLNTTAGQTTTLNYMNSAHLMPWDPRGTRYGPSEGRYRHFMASTPSFTTITTAGHPDSFTYATFYPTTYFTGDANAYLGNLPQFTAFQDGDGVTRMPDAGLGYNSSNNRTNIANPYTPTVLANAASSGRPVILQRPYRSVAELGYVYRDVPWQTLNFYNNNGGDSALLDLFSVSDEPTQNAGRVFLGTPYSSVLAALLNGAPQEFDGTQPLTNTTTISNISGALIANSYSSGLPSSSFPTNAANLADLMWLSGVTNSTTGLSVIKRYRESVVRSLAADTQTRTWNVLIDIVAQTGRFSALKGTYGSGDFAVQGESHQWISVAIDRYTGKIVDEQVENVHE